MQFSDKLYASVNSVNPLLTGEETLIVGEIQVVRLKWFELRNVFCLFHISYRV